MWYYCKAYLIKYLCILVPVVALFWLVKIDVVFFAFFFGIYIGALACDLIWLNHTNKTWGFYKKMIDWEKVEELATPAKENI